MVDLGKGPQAWLKNSLVARAQSLRLMERRCIKAYTKGEMRIAAERLAGTYAKAAACFEDAVLMYCDEKDPTNG